MLVEIHLLQNFPPSCLNRDDLNSPKECEFGGHRRARVSSQCLKRSIRHSEPFAEAVGPSGAIGTRTKLLEKRLADELIARGRPAEPAQRVARLVAEAIGSGGKDGRTSVALYLGHDEIARILAAIEERFAEAADSDTTADSQDDAKPARGRGKKPKTESPAQLLAAEMRDQFKPGTKAADIALFGRMIAEATNFNVDAACQVAHAISTHRVAPELDFFTAVDDLQPEDVTGAGMLGTQEFNSPCLYRYANVHLPQLAKNLGGDLDLALAATLGFVRASVLATPSAKQNSHAAFSHPDLVFVLVRRSGPPLSLANAFVQPVQVRRPDDHLVALSADRLATYWNKLHGALGDLAIAAAFHYSLLDTAPDLSGAQSVAGLAPLVSGMEPVVRDLLATTGGHR